LTDVAIRNAKPADKPYKLSDYKGLYLLVSPAGKYWRFNYRYLGKQKTLAVGVYPDTSLEDARGRRDEARALLAKDIDPSLMKRVAKQAKQHANENTFQAIALEWHVKQSVTWADSTAHNIKRC